jgi:SAM-dependent methyltransferase
LRHLALEHWAAARFEAAVHEAWAAYRANPQDCDSKVLLARLLRSFPKTIAADQRSDLLRLLQDRDIAPEYLSAAGWLLIMRDDSWTAAANHREFGPLAARLDGDKLGLALLRETPVIRRDAERALTRLRRWLLLSGQWHSYRRLVDAFSVQAMLNGGAWPFDDVECKALGQTSPMVAAYLPAQNPVHKPRTGHVADPVTRAVSEDYERWPYPDWTRVMIPKRTRLPEVIRALDPAGPDCLPSEAKILVAGCGTGRQAVMIALGYPDAAVTAIDMSETSLRYARQQSAGIRNIRFLNFDLHNISELNERFHAIFCSGVLHHLPDPEHGLAALANVLYRGGVMNIMVYSRIARLWIEAMRKLISDFALESVNADLLRRVRQRIMDGADSWPIQDPLDFADFSTLAGTHDMLLHRHVDPFDVPRIAQALDRLGLRLLSFVLPTPDAKLRYNAMFPHDPLCRDLSSWAWFERTEPTIFSGMYDFWCRKDDGVGSQNDSFGQSIFLGPI